MTAAKYNNKYFAVGCLWFLGLLLFLLDVEVFAETTPLSCTLTTQEFCPGTWSCNSGSALHKPMISAVSDTYIVTVNHSSKTVDVVDSQEFRYRESARISDSLISWTRKTSSYSIDRYSRKFTYSNNGPGGTIKQTGTCDPRKKAF